METHKMLKRMICGQMIFCRCELDGNCSSKLETNLFKFCTIDYIHLAEKITRFTDIFFVAKEKNKSCFKKSECETFYAL